MFNKTSLKFTLGFVAILILGFVGVYIIGYFYEQSKTGVGTTNPTGEKPGSLPLAHITP